MYACSPPKPQYPEVIEFPHIIERYGFEEAIDLLPLFLEQAVRTLLN
jgi:hypothetical protein